MRGVAGIGAAAGDRQGGPGGHGRDETEAVARTWSSGRFERQPAADGGQALGHAAEPAAMMAVRNVRGGWGVLSLAGETAAVVGDLEGHLAHPLSEPDPAVPGAGVAEYGGGGPAPAPGQHPLRGPGGRARTPGKPG